MIPFAVGAIAQAKGVAVLQPIVVAILIFILISWLMMPGGFRRGGLERAREQKITIGSDFKVTAQWIMSKFKNT